MSKMWKGPCAELLATHANPIATRLHRRAGERLISYDINHEGTLATVYRLEKRGKEWFRIDLGVARGGDPMNTFINASLYYTEHDQELFSLIARHIEARTDDVIGTLREISKNLGIVIEDIGDCLSSLASRYV